MRTRLDMPKKSKKEKIIAEQKRRLHPHNPVTPQVLMDSAVQQSPTFKFQLNKKHIIPSVETTYSDQTELTAIKHDLTKTLILAFVAVSAELALYWLGRGKI